MIVRSDKLLPKVANPKQFNLYSARMVVKQMRMKILASEAKNKYELFTHNRKDSDWGKESFPTLESNVQF